MPSTNKNKMVAVHMPDDMRERLENISAKNGLNRSVMIRKILLEYLDEHENDNAPNVIRIKEVRRILNNE